MSTVRDAEGNILNPPTPAVLAGKYSDERALNVDWFDLHPEDRTPEAELAFGDATVAGERAEFASGKDETLSGLRETFVAEVLAAKGDTSELRAARENYLDALEANKIIEVIPEPTEPTLTKVLVVEGQPVAVVPDVEANKVIAELAAQITPATESTEIKENQNGTISSNPSDKNVESHDSSVSSSTNV